MLIIAAALYWLLCSRVTVRLTLAGGMSGGRFSLTAACPLVRAAVSGACTLEMERGKPRLALCSGDRRIVLPRRKAKRRGVRSRAGAAALHALRIRRAYAAVCVGLGDAAKTAVAAGLIRASLASAFAVRRISDTRIQVDAHYGGVCLMANAECIFSARLGDIVMAAAKAALAGEQNQSGERVSDGKASH